MENINFSLKSLNWTTLLKERSEDSYDSDETFCDEINMGSNENCPQNCVKNSNKHECEIDHQPLNQEIFDTSISNQNTAPKEERNVNPFEQNIQYETQVNDESCIVGTSSHNNSFSFSNTRMDINNHIEEGNKVKHRFESDFGFTDDMSCSKSFLNTTQQISDVCTDKPIISTGCNSDESIQFGSESSLALKNIEDESKTLDSELKMVLETNEICNASNLESVTRANCLTFEEISTNEFLSMTPGNVGEDEILDGLLQNLDQSLMYDNFLNSFMGYHEVCKIKSCSPPLTLNKVSHRKVLPADKILPNYKKKNWQAEKKLLPPRKCSSAYIDLSNRKSDKISGKPTDTEESDILAPITDSEVPNVEVQSQTRRENCRKQLFEVEVIKAKRDRKLKQTFPIKVKRGRKKKSIFGREKIETETTAESASKETELNRGIDETLHEIKIDVEYIEERVARWISGSDDDPPTRQLAFKMLADCQSCVAKLQHLKKHESKKKYINKCELKLLKLLLERSKQLEITIDKAIAEADRLMKMELNEIYEDCQTTGKESFATGVTKEYKYLKPILRHSSSDPSTEERVSNRRSISFSGEVDCRYLSCSEQSSSFDSSQSFYENQIRNISISDKKEINNVSRCNESVCNNLYLRKCHDAQLIPTANLSQKNNPFEINENPELDLLSFKNLVIDPCVSLNHRKSEVRPYFERKENGVMENMCMNDIQISVKNSQTKNNLMMKNLDEDENHTSKNDHFLHSENTFDDTNCEPNQCNSIEYSEENNNFTQDHVSQYSFSDNLNCNPVIDNSKYMRNQTKDLLKERTLAFSSDVSIHGQKQESSQKTSEKNIQADENNSFGCDPKQMNFYSPAVKGNVLQNETSFQCPEASKIKVNVHSTCETDGFNKNALLRLNENSTHLSENFGFSEQNTQVEESWKSFSIMSIKSIRVADPSEFMPWAPTDPPDDWADLEDWSMCINKVDEH